MSSRHFYTSNYIIDPDCGFGWSANIMMHHMKSFDPSHPNSPLMVMPLSFSQLCFVCPASIILSPFANLLRFVPQTLVKLPFFILYRVLEMDSEYLFFLKWLVKNVNPRTQMCVSSSVPVFKANFALVVRSQLALVSIIIFYFVDALANIPLAQQASVIVAISARLLAAISIYTFHY